MQPGNNRGSARNIACGSPLRRIGSLCAVLALTLAACGQEPEVAKPDIRPVRAVTVEKRDGGETLQLAGVVESQIQVDLAFRIGGRMVERLVNVGDVVKAGQVIARLDPTDEQNALRAAKANLAAANGQLSEARINYERQRHLSEREIASRAAFERAEQVYTTAQASVTAAEAQLGIAQQRLDDTQLVADAPGIVTAQGAEPGEVVQPGRMVVQIARDDGRDAVFNVPATSMGRAGPDPEVQVWLSLTPSVTAEGRLREVSPSADPVTGTFRVRVGLINPPADMRLGSSVVGRTTFARHAGLEIPATALTGTEGQPAVWVVDPKTMTVSLRQIGIARYNPGSAVISEGVTPGELVVTAGVQALRPGQKVRLLGAQS